MKLSEYLALNDLTAADFAEKADLSPSTVSRAINEKRRPQWPTLSKIMAATNNKVTPNDFVTEGEGKAA